jgi:hypothetical protein
MGTQEKFHKSEGGALIFVQDLGFELKIDQEQKFHPDTD